MGRIMHPPPPLPDLYVQSNMVLLIQCNIEQSSRTAGATTGAVGAVGGFDWWTASGAAAAKGNSTVSH